MTIQFCVVREKTSGQYVCHKEEVWGYGSTMTGPMTETVFDLSTLSNLMGQYADEHFTMFESKESAQKWIESSSGKHFIKEQEKNIANFNKRHGLPVSEIQLEVVTFADIDSIIEQQLLGDEQ